jgi:hypothetical protein
MDPALKKSPLPEPVFARLDEGMPMTKQRRSRYDQWKTRHDRNGDRDQPQYNQQESGRISKILSHGVCYFRLPAGSVFQQDYENKAAAVRLHFGSTVCGCSEGLAIRLSVDVRGDDEIVRDTEDTRNGISLRVSELPVHFVQDNPGQLHMPVLHDDSDRGLRIERILLQAA